MRITILLLMLSLSYCASAGDVRMWRDEQGKLHFGDVPPQGTHSDRVIVKPNGAGRQDRYSDGGGQQPTFQERLDGMMDRRDRDLSRTASQEQPSKGLSYDERIRLRELYMEKRRVQDDLRKGTPSLGQGFASGLDLDGINQQIRDLESRQ